MEPDYRSLPAITNRSFDFTTYPSQEETDPGDAIFEGRTEALSRRHLRGIITRQKVSVNSSGEEPLVERPVLVKFYAISSALDRVHGRIVELEETDDIQYRWIVEIEFDRDLNLLEMRL
jgi:hypothetical protein